MTATETWVFGYGSLMWRPDFAFQERRRATITGLHRAFCIASTHYRGSPKRPGLVLGLDQGRTCTGVAFRIAPADAQATIAYLRARELIYGVYRETHVPALLSGPDAREVEVLTYIAERGHPSYAGHLPLEHQSRVIQGARGVMGPNLDYLINTVRHLADLGIPEPELQRLAALAAGYAARVGDTGATTRPAAAALYRVWSATPSLLAPRSGDPRRFLYRQRLSG